MWWGIGLFLLIVVCGYIVLFCLHVVRETERAVKVTLGNPVSVLESGLCFVFFPFQYLRRFSTEMIELGFRECHVVTKKDPKTECEQVRIGVESTLYFRWPCSDELVKVLRAIPNAEDIEKVKNLFEETVLDAVRSRGAEYTWKEMVGDRKGFAADVKRSLFNDPDDPLVQAGIGEGTTRIVIQRVTLPEGLEGAISAPEIARLNAEADVKKAEGERKAIGLKGEGERSAIKSRGRAEAEVRKILFDAIGKDPDRLVLEQLLTLREMAKGTSNTIFVPSEVASALAGIRKTLDSASFERMLKSAGLEESLIRKITDGLKSKGGEGK